MTDQSPPPADDEAQENEVLRAARELQQQREARSTSFSS